MRFRSLDRMLSPYRGRSGKHLGSGVYSVQKWAEQTLCHLSERTTTAGKSPENPQLLNLSTSKQLHPEENKHSTCHLQKEGTEKAGPCWLWQAPLRKGVRRRVGRAGEGTADQRLPSPDPNHSDERLKSFHIHFLIHAAPPPQA